MVLQQRGPLALLGLAGLLIAGCAGTAATPAKTTASFAEQPAAAPDYIFPLTSMKYYSIANVFQFQYLMYRPLYWFGMNGQVQLNSALSLADPPVYSADGKAVTVTLKGWRWSDGQPITTRDIQFWQNLVTANKAAWPAYLPGEYPDNVISTTINSAMSITFNLSLAYGATFFTDNELSQITPLPQHLWDRESIGGTVADYDMTASGAQAVYKFLDAQASTVASYNTNPLWRVVDGPWRMKSIDAAGNLRMVPNPGYSGPVKPKLTEFDEVPFSADGAELAALKSASSARTTQIDYGYLPPESGAQAGALSSVYTSAPWPEWQIGFIPENFTNPTSGPMFQQLYFRQALQHLVDQDGLVGAALLGDGYATYGPVPTRPVSVYLDTIEQTNPYPYSPQDAITLLTQHGWMVNAGGVSTCASPGTAAGQCGAGIARGALASFSLEYNKDVPAEDSEMNKLKADFALAGVQLTLSKAPFDQVTSDAAPCVPGRQCTWDMEYWGGGWLYAPDYLPTGDELWSTGAGSNYGGYTDPMTDQLVHATMFTNDPHALNAYQDYTAEQLPVIWMPVSYQQLSEINKSLKGTLPQDPILNITPENWSWS